MKILMPWGEIETHQTDQQLLAVGFTIISPVKVAIPPLSCSPSEIALLASCPEILLELGQ